MQGKRYHSLRFPFVRIAQVAKSTKRAKGKGQGTSENTDCGRKGPPPLLLIIRPIAAQLEHTYNRNDQSQHLPIGACYRAAEGGTSRAARHAFNPARNAPPVPHFTKEALLRRFSFVLLKISIFIVRSSQHDIKRLQYDDIICTSYGQLRTAATVVVPYGYVGLQRYFLNRAIAIQDQARPPSRL